MESQFKRLLSLAKKTGDSFVILDEQNGESYILLSLDKYESLLDTKPRLQELAPIMPQPTTEETQKGEMEAIEGQGTKVVNLSKIVESEANSAEKYYFEELQDQTESQEEEDSKEVEPLK